MACRNSESTSLKNYVTNCLPPHFNHFSPQKVNKWKFLDQVKIQIFPLRHRSYRNCKPPTPSFHSMIRALKNYILCKLMLIDVINFISVSLSFSQFMNSPLMQIKLKILYQSQKQKSETKFIAHIYKKHSAKS